MTLLVPPRVRLSKVVLVIAGGLQTFRDVRDALDPTDISTGTSVPVRDHKPPLRGLNQSLPFCVLPVYFPWPLRHTLLTPHDATGAAL